MIYHLKYEHRPRKEIPITASWTKLHAEFTNIVDFFGQYIHTIIIRTLYILDYVKLRMEHLDCHVNLLDTEVFRRNCSSLLREWKLIAWLNITSVHVFTCCWNYTPWVVTTYCSVLMLQYMYVPVENRNITIKHG